MSRRLMIVLGLVALVGTLLPAQPTSASNEGTAAALISGIVDPTTTECSIDGKKPEHGLLGGGQSRIVEFNEVAMLGVFDNYAGLVTVPNGIDACAEQISPPDPPLNELAGWGRIDAGAFEGDNAITGKCVRGALIDDPTKGWAGDFSQVGALVLVKFDIAYETGNLVAGDCLTPKNGVEELNCLGALIVAPIESVTGVDVVGDPVAGPLVCHPLMPSNKGSK